MSQIYLAVIWRLPYGMKYSAAALQFHDLRDQLSKIMELGNAGGCFLLYYYSYIIFSEKIFYLQ